jgi:hypothetical protein
MRGSFHVHLSGSGDRSFRTRRGDIPETGDAREKTVGTPPSRDESRKAGDLDGARWGSRDGEDAGGWTTSSTQRVHTRDHAAGKEHIQAIRRNRRCARIGKGKWHPTPPTAEEFGRESVRCEADRGRGHLQKLFELRDILLEDVKGSKAAVAPQLCVGHDRGILVAKAVLEA